MRTLRLVEVAVRLPLLSLCCLAAAGVAHAEPSGAAASEWRQWGQNPQHTGFIQAEGQAPRKQLADIVYDPFVAQEQTESFGALTVHYQAPLVDHDRVYMMFKTGVYVSCPTQGSWAFNGDACGPNTWNQQIWNEKALVWRDGTLQTEWSFQSDWKPEPNGYGLSGWEPVFHPALTSKFLYVPGFGGTVWKVDKEHGTAISQINPFGSTVDPNTFVSGPLTADAKGNVYYNAIKLIDPSLADPWYQADVRGAWLVKVTPDGDTQTVTYATLVPGAPAAFGPAPSYSNCPYYFYDTTTLPWPPSPDAVPSPIPCGSQRPGVNVAPAIAPDGTIYTVSRGHFDEVVGYLIAVNPDLTPKWQASLQNRFNDGCGVLMPIATTPSPTQPGSCRAGTTPGVDPTTNAPGSGWVTDSSSSTPVALPDGSVLYGAWGPYDVTRGHLMKFSSSGDFLAAYDFGWDSTPAVVPHDDSYSIVVKDNHYGIGQYCYDPTNPVCASLPNGPYYITWLDPNLQPQRKFQNTTTDSCQRNPDGSLTCTPNTNPNGFEWCINAPAIDADGLVYANSEDGSLYVLNPDGTQRHRIFLNLAIGAAYTPLSLGPDGRIYTQNDGQLFVAGSGDE